MTTQKTLEYKLVNYSFVIKNSNFEPSNNYDNKKIGDENKYRLYVNLKTPEQRKLFFSDLKNYNDNATTEKVRAKELSYEYFIRSVQSNDKKISFKDIIEHIKEVMNENSLGELSHCFRVSNEWKNYKVVVTSYDLAVLLNKDKMFVPYRKHKYINVNTSTQTNVDTMVTDM
jgi:hypothetical protein